MFKVFNTSCNSSVSPAQTAAAKSESFAGSSNMLVLFFIDVVKVAICSLNIEFMLEISLNTCKISATRALTTFESLSSGSFSKAVILALETS
ncbi:hypothetical protein WICPIJ_003973 [Wickerhamomyces pijperi]|uniref:Uncharacterized protein n=1 Tax=Wickerhamomyces pijperi TaxID=599730 RepID=A0A9P8TN73_WICPI|nr:hypothetical protein WICPIJ_003973 [Wickerhamomyces pijperi]